MMVDAILVLNAGSSSIKFGLFAVSGTEPRLLCKGLLDEHQAKPGFTVTDAADKYLYEKRHATADDNGEALLADILYWSSDYLAGGTLAAVGHRVVHGGRNFDGPAEVTDKTIEAMAALTPLAPLHQPRCLSPIRAIRSLRPGLTQIACFEPPSIMSSRHPSAASLSRGGSKRWASAATAFTDFPLNLSPTVLPDLADPGRQAHRGGPYRQRSEPCAMRNGRSVDTTMGLTPLDGLMMGTRSGAIDPGVLLYLQQQGMSLNDLQHMLYQESGLLGVSGLSADMRALLASDDPHAAESIELFTFRVAREVAAMANTLGGLECLVFTGGVGEHSAEIRQQICERLQWLGPQVDHSANDPTSECISTENSRVDIRVIPTSEETMIARHCSKILRAQG